MCNSLCTLAPCMSSLASSALRHVDCPDTFVCPNRLVDTLPKHWGGAGSAAVSGQLEDKTNAHGSLLHCLEDGGCLPRLPASVLRCACWDQPVQQDLLPRVPQTLNTCAVLGRSTIVCQSGLDLPASAE